MSDTSNSDDSTWMEKTSQSMLHGGIGDWMGRMGKLVFKVFIDMKNVLNLIINNILNAEELKNIKFNLMI